MNNIIGVFLGLQHSAYEYIAEIIAPYKSDFRPKIGSFMLIDNIDEYLVARVMDYVPRGELTSFMGEKWLADVALTPEAIGQDIKNKKICYRVKIKLLGCYSKTKRKFTAGITEIPHITSTVIVPTTEDIKLICNQALEDQQKGPKIGAYWLDPNVDIHFDVQDLISKRTFIFARAGYGKSNLMKILASNWKKQFGSLVIFDPEGEYAFTDNKGRPGIMDKIPALLITNRLNYSGKTNVCTDIRFNLKDFSPTFIIPIIVPENKQEFIFFGKLMNLRQEGWNELVDLLFEQGWGADRAEIRRIVEGEDSTTSDSDLQPIINNLVSPIRRLHDPNSNLLSIIEKAVDRGEIIIFDISLMDSSNALKFSSIIVGHFFNMNQRHFAGSTQGIKKAVFVVEEAQSVLGSNSGNSRFVELAKEGRKYMLGGIFITQQPGSIPNEILSQADNFFTFHLLSKGDLNSLQKSNAHYSEDVLTQLLNEPIRGKAYMWTSNQPFVLPVKIENFETLAKSNNSDNVQVSYKILSELMGEISGDDEILQSIIKKSKKIYGLQIEDKKRTVLIFKELNDKEKEYCRNRGFIQRNTSLEEFAITFECLKKLRELVANMKDEDSNREDIT